MRSTLLLRQPRARSSPISRVRSKMDIRTVFIIVTPPMNIAKKEMPQAKPPTSSQSIS